MTSPTHDRVEQGNEILRNRTAQGEPGTKQPAHEDATEAAKRTVETLNNMTSELTTGKHRGPSAKEGHENHEVPPAERTTGPTPVATASLDMAAGAVSAARAQLENQLVADARLASDPRYERDQKVYELGQAGKLGRVPPSPAEIAAANPNISPEVLEELPKTPEEQVAQDMPRLEAAENKSAEINSAVANAQGEGDEGGFLK